MTKLIEKTEKLNIFNEKYFSKILETAKLEYISDISWGYRVEHQDYILDFYQDEKGINHVEEFLLGKKDVWIAISPTKNQIYQMFDKLNKTEYRPVKPEPEYIGDPYEYYGVEPKNFY